MASKAFSFTRYEFYPMLGEIHKQTVPNTNGNSVKLLTACENTSASIVYGKEMQLIRLKNLWYCNIDW